MDSKHFEQTRSAAAEYNERVFGYPNVIGCGVGRRTVAGRKTDEPCLVVYVEHKLPPEALRAGDMLPRTVETRHGDLMIDIVERRMAVAFADTATYRPLRGGCEIASAESGGGTLGAIMYDRRDAQTVLLTCNHVLTRAGERSVVPANPTVFQPAGGASIGRTKRIVPWLPPPLGGEAICGLGWTPGSSLLIPRLMRNFE